MVLPGGTEENSSRHLNNTPSPVFCALMMICLRIMAVRRWRVPSLLTSGSKEKQMDCSSEIKPLSSKRPWKESASTWVW